MLILIKAFPFAQHYSRDMDDYHVRINLAFTFPFSSCNIGNLIISSVSYFIENLESVSIYCPTLSAPHDYFYLVCRMSFERGFQICRQLSLRTALSIPRNVKQATVFFLWVGMGAALSFLFVVKLSFLKKYIIIQRY